MLTPNRAGYVPVSAETNALGPETSRAYRNAGWHFGRPLRAWPARSRIPGDIRVASLSTNVSAHATVAFQTDKLFLKTERSGTLAVHAEVACFLAQQPHLAVLLIPVTLATSCSSYQQPMLHLRLHSVYRSGRFSVANSASPKVLKDPRVRMISPSRDTILYSTLLYSVLLYAALLLYFAVLYCTILSCTIPYIVH